MSSADLLGRFATLKISRFATPGAYLTIDDDEEILLVGSEIPRGAKVGDELSVFVHLDSEARPLATTRRAKLALGQVAFLEVTASTPIGAFADWGLAKELLVPFKQQTATMNVGARYAIGLYVDNTGRLAGTMRVSEMLATGGARNQWTVDEWVEGEAWRDDPEIGLFVIIEKAFVGLVPKSEPTTLARGDASHFRIASVLPDGKIELSLRGHAHEEIAGDAAKILAVLARPDAPPIGDRCSPEEIRALFGLSKKAFKRAAGRLLRDRAVSIGADGYLKPAR